MRPIGFLMRGDVDDGEGHSQRLCRRGRSYAGDGGRRGVFDQAGGEAMEGRCLGVLAQQKKPAVWLRKFQPRLVRLP